MRHIRREEESGLLFNLAALWSVTLTLAEDET